MQRKLIFSAALSALAATATAAPFEAPYSLTAVHADFQAQLEQVAGKAGDVGTTARFAADLMAPHNAAQERLILPILGYADVATTGHMSANPQLGERLQVLAADLAQMGDSEVDLVTALVEFYAAADAAGQPDITRLAERMIWHEVSDIEVLYPAALLIGASLQARLRAASPASLQGEPGPLYRPGVLPVISVGDPQKAGKGN